MNARAWIFAAVALTGFVLTQYYLVLFIHEVQGQPTLEGMLSFDVAAFVAGGFANPSASFLSIDVIVSVACFLLWVFPEGKRLGMRNVWVYAALTFMVAMAVSFPLFMMMRERALVRAAAATP